MEESWERWRQYYYHMAAEVQTATNWREQDRIERELPNILSLISQAMLRLPCEELENKEIVLHAQAVPTARALLQFINAVDRTYRMRGYWNECEEMWRTAIYLARLLNDTVTIGDRCYDLGNVSYYRGDIAAAEQMVLAARVEWERGGNQRRIYEHAQRLLGMIALERGQVDEAETLLNEALVQYQRIGGVNGLPNLLSSLGDLAQRRGQLVEAAAWYQRAIEAAEQQNDVPNIAANATYLGMAKFTAGDPAAARACYDQGLRLAEECRRTDLIARALLSLAELESVEGRQNIPIDYARQALDLFRRLGMKREQAEAEALLAKIAEEAQDS